MAGGRASPSDIDAISERLMLTRKAVKLKKSQFADRAGISRTAYDNWEPAEGKRPAGRPSLDEAYKLCEAYELTLDWIYRGDRRRLPHELVEAIETVEKELAIGRFAPATPRPKRA